MLASALLSATWLQSAHWLGVGICNPGIQSPRCQHFNLPAVITEPNFLSAVPRQSISIISPLLHWQHAYQLPPPHSRSKCTSPFSLNVSLATPPFSIIPSFLWGRGVPTDRNIIITLQQKKNKKKKKTQFKRNWIYFPVASLHFFLPFSLFFLL